MKKFVFVLFAAFVGLNFYPTAHTCAASSEYYAKVQQSEVYFCSLPSVSSALFEIPQSYFVKVDYVVDEFYKVTYKNLDGYVKKSDVTLMTGIPTTPYPTTTATVWVSYDLFSAANRSSTTLTTLQAQQTVDFYGAITGEEVVSGNGLWYYVSTGTQYGYVYHRAFDSISIPTNSEVFDLVSEEILTSSSEFSSLSTGTKIILIVAISVPSVLILYFLIKPSKIMQTTKSSKKTKKERKKIHHGDYYEFDESEL